MSRIKCDSPYPMSRVLTDYLTHAYTEYEKPNRHYVPSMTIFQNKRFLFYKSKPLDGSQYQLEFPKLCVFMHLWATDFWVYTVERRAPFQHFYGLSPLVIMSNCKRWVFQKPCDSFWTLSHFAESTIEHQTQCRLTMYT